jgi:hypothetical protein
LTNANTTTNKSCLWFKSANYLSEDNLIQTIKGKPFSNIENQNSSNNFPITSTYYLSIHDVPNVWETLKIKDVFLQKAFLNCVESYAPKGMRFVYWVFFKGEMPVGFAYGQIQDFNTYNSISALHEPAKGNWWQRFQFTAKKLLAKSVNFTTLVVGNLMLTGEHAFYFDETTATEVNIPALLVETIKKTSKQLKSHKFNIHLLKDYFENTPLDFTAIEQQNYQKIGVQPNMIVKIRPEWKTFDAYLSAMSSKYRVRAKRAFKKGEGIEKRALTLAEIDENNDTIFDLYQNIVRHASFNSLFLNERYFYGLKEHLKDDFQLIGYFMDGKLIGFYTLIFSGKHLDAHFLGVKDEYNNNYQVYLNMLYDMVKAGIDRQMSEVIMGRTALEIKSSVGAEPFEMFGYTKLRNPIFNTFLRRFADDWLIPEKWVQRTPFK